MEGKSYLEILAENDAEARVEFDPNAKDKLVENVHEYEDDVEGQDHHPDELENQEDFNKPQGSYHEAAGLPEKAGAGYIDHTVFSVRYKSNDIRTIVYNIDSRFRDNPSITPSTNFRYRFIRPYRNIRSLRISGIEFPNVSYVFTAAKENILFNITLANAIAPVVVGIGEGNYEDPYFFAETIQTALNTKFPNENFTVTMGASTAKLTISNSTNFVLDFNPYYEVGFVRLPPLLNNGRLFGNGIGYNMGFRKKVYSGNSSYTGEAVVDTIESNYILLSLGSEYKVLTHRIETTTVYMFAKILVTEPKNAVVFDNGSNTITKEFNFKQPTDISYFDVLLTDPYEQPLDLLGINFSFTVEMDEVLDHGLYKKLISN
jgi:hypothetical protein